MIFSSSLKRLAIVVRLALTCATALVGCGAGGDDGSADSTDTPSLGGAPGDPGSLGANGPNGPSANDLNACATSSAHAEKIPLYLVFMFDRSLSMFGARLANRWGPCKAATEAFFASAENGNGLHASLGYFPHAGSILTCDPDPYATPAVAMTSLPSTVFSASLDKTIPQFGTPLEPALTGAVAYAKSIADGEGKDGKVALVLVSDGEPVGCGSSVAGTASIAEGVSDTIATYVIGIGDGKALNDIAVAGGTKQAIAVSDSNAAETEASFRSALDAVRSSALACEYTIPAPPNGETFDRSKVNIVHKPESGKDGITILYDQKCASAGWRYDNEAAPTRVILCDQTCKELEAAKAGKVDVLFGCTTRGVPVK